MSRGPSGSQISAGGGLRSRIILSMGTVLVLVTLLTGFCLYTVLSLPQTTAPPAGPPAQPSTNADRAAEQIAALLAEVRTHEQMFGKQPAPASVVKFEEAGKNLLARTLSFEKNAKQENNAKGAQAAAQIIQQISRYTTSFKELVQAWEARGITDDAGLRQQLTKAGQNLTAPTAPTENTQGLEAGLMKLGKAEQNYFAAPTQDNQRLLSQAAASLNKAVADSQLQLPEKKALAASIKNYTTAFDRYLAVSLATTDPALSSTFAAAQVKQEETMHRAALEMEKLISGRNASQSSALLLSLHEQEQEYLKQANGDNAAKVVAALAEYEKSLDSTAAPKQQDETMKRAAEGYQAAFVALVEQDKKIDQLRTKVEDSFTALQSLVKGATAKTPPAPPATKALGAPENLPSLAVIGAGWLVIVLITLLLARMLTTAVTAPIVRMTDIARRMATQGDFSHTFPPEKNEFAALAGALNAVVRPQATDTTAVRTAAAELPAQQDNLDQALADEAGLGIRIADALAGQEETLARARNMVTQLAVEAGKLQQTASGLSEFGQSVHSSANGCEQSVSATVENVQGLGRSAAQLASLITAFTDMAEQTSIVALNAAIKSTRFGTQGKEFSAVTEELDRLAKNAAESAKEITALLETLTAGIAAGEKLGSDSRQGLQNLATTSSAGLEAINEISSAASALQTGSADADALLAQLAGALNQADALVRELSPINRTIMTDFSRLGNETSPDGEPYQAQVDQS